MEENPTWEEVVETALKAIKEFGWSLEDIENHLKEEGQQNEQ